MRNEALAKAFELRRARALEPSEALGREARNRVVNNFCILGQRVADAEIRMPNQSHHVPGVSLVHRFALATEQFVRAGKPQLPPGARMDDIHVARELPRANAHEGQTVPMPRVHVRLNLENETGEAGMLR
jgi:hypothetical protein